MQGIPYRLAVREDTGTNNARLAIWLFLASEVLFFGALISSYVLLRLNSEAWPRGAERLELLPATINTLVLILSSVTMMQAYEKARDADLKRSRRFLAVTALLGVGFSVVKLVEWRDKLSAGAGPATDLFYALYFTLTGVHLLHLLAGCLVLTDLARRSRQIEESCRGLFAHRVEIAGIYWHFVDLVWLVLFPLLYLT